MGCRAAWLGVHRVQARLHLARQRAQTHFQHLRRNPGLLVFRISPLRQGVIRIGGHKGHQIGFQRPAQVKNLVQAVHQLAQQGRQARRGRVFVHLRQFRIHAHLQCGDLRA